ncbi:hypothetical protein ACLKA6_002985 [Drosophila palustris]
MQLCGLGEVITNPVGCFRAELEVDGICKTHRIVVVNDKDMVYDALLGFDLMSKFSVKLSPKGFNFSELEGESEEKNKMSDIYSTAAMEPEIDVPHQFKNQVKELIKNSIHNGAPAECPVMMKITPDGEIAPFRQAPSRLAIAEEEDVNKQINECVGKRVQLIELLRKVRMSEMDRAAAGRSP